MLVLRMMLCCTLHCISLSRTRLIRAVVGIWRYTRVGGAFSLPNECKILIVLLLNLAPQFCCHIMIYWHIKDSIQSAI